MEKEVTDYLITAVSSWEEHSLLSNLLNYIPEIRDEIRKNKLQSSCHMLSQTDEIKGERGGQVEGVHRDFYSTDFTSTSTLNRQLKVHTREKAFNCKVCHKAFSTKPGLQ